MRFSHLYCFFLYYFFLCCLWNDRIANFKISMCNEQNGINKFEIQRATRDTTRKFDRSTSCRCVDTEQNSNLSQRLYASFPGFFPWFSLSWKSRSPRSTSRILILFYPEIVSSHCYYSFWGFHDKNSIIFNIVKFLNNILQHLTCFHYRILTRNVDRLKSIKDPWCTHLKQKKFQWVEYFGIYYIKKRII